MTFVNAGPFHYPSLFSWPASRRKAIAGIPNSESGYRILPVASTTRKRTWEHEKQIWGMNLMKSQERNDRRSEREKEFCDVLYDLRILRALQEE